MVRKLVLSYHHPELRLWLHGMLDQQSTAAIWTHYMVVETMVQYTNVENQIPHGIPKPRAEWTIEELNANEGIKPEWDFALQCLAVAWRLRRWPDEPLGLVSPLVKYQGFAFYP